MAAKTKIFTIPVWIAYLAMVFPLLLSYVKKENTPDLAGLVISKDRPELDAANWFSGTYQSETDDYNSDHWSLKEISVRLNNQFYYNAFRQIRVNGFVTGKDDYVFSESFILSAYGDDFIGEARIKTQMEKAKVLQDTLKKKGIDLMMVFAPGKGVLCEEYVSDKYKHPVTNTNYAEYVKQCRNYGVNYLDLMSYFKNAKANSPYPLYSRFGHHWSYFAECVAMDTINGFIEKLHGCNLPDSKWHGIDIIDTSRPRDADIIDGMNLYSKPDQHMKLAYPDISYEEDSLKNSVRVLTIADSYWYGPVYKGIGYYCYNNGEFWYYNNKIIPSPIPGEKVEVWQIDLKAAIESNQVIQLVYSDGTLTNFGNGFIENAYELYTSPKTFYERTTKNFEVLSAAKEIRQTPRLLKKVTLLSNELQISLDSAIKMEARKMAAPKIK